MVVARNGDDVVKVALANRFQEAIDEAAMRVGASDADAYMDGWRRTEWESAEGTPTEVSEAISKKLETQLDEAALNALLDSLNQ